MSGRQTKFLNEQAQRHGIPFGGASINLPTIVSAFHDFLADDAVKLARDDDPLMQGVGSPALERNREERAAIARLDRLEREEQLVPRDEARKSLGRVATVLRSAGDSLQRRFGPDAAEILHEAFSDTQREINRTFGVEEHEAEPTDERLDQLDPPDPG